MVVSYIFHLPQISTSASFQLLWVDGLGSIIKNDWVHPMWGPFNDFAFYLDVFSWIVIFPTSLCSCPKSLLKISLTEAHLLLLLWSLSHYPLSAQPLPSLPTHWLVAFRHVQVSLPPYKLSFTPVLFYITMTSPSFLDPKSLMWVVFPHPPFNI